MINCIYVKDNTINENKIKNISEDIIFKKCHYKNSTDFLKIKSWDYNGDQCIELWGKNKGLNYNKSNFIIFKNYNIDIFGKSIFLMKQKSNDKYISLNYNEFINFFKLDEKNEQSEKNEPSEKNELSEKNEKDKDKDNDDELSEYSYNSELSYELYCYSSDDN